MPKRFIDLMEKCWSQHPKDRPAISDIVKELEDMSNAESRQAVQEELPNGSSENALTLCDNFAVEHLSVHQGYVIEIAGKRTADDMRKHNKILESTGNEIDKLKDAGNACVFLGLSISLKATEILNNATDVDQNINEILECLKSIAEGAICDLPSKINSYRNMDSCYSVTEAIDIMRQAGIITCDINASEMLLSNPSLMEDQQKELKNAVLTLMESKESEAAIYVCPPLAITLIKVSKTPNQGCICVVDTHSVPKELGGNDNEYDESTKRSKCSSVCEWLSKRTSLYGIPGETRQTLIKVKETADALTNFEWDEWNTSEMDEILKNILPKDNQELNEIKKDKETMSNNLNNEDTSDVNVTFNEKAATPEQKEVNENNETGPSDLEELCGEDMPPS
ncbi:hypothetical protein OS493_036778 [Desmophyllum pertusum]|uniref:Uncharacterized protein n=1 Tax=Desmophyllum pertusum TaxID=174260 RepID=A0A9X0CHV6_9CNID|nr:hypothetical protein OS493_036778 [Desmophyllum pertusum]